MKNMIKHPSRIFEGVIYMKTVANIMILSVALMALAACGMNEQEPGSATSGITNGALSNTVGLGECFSCHRDGANPGVLNAVMGDSAGKNGWINSAHANFNNSTYFGDPDLVGSCSTNCHDTLGIGNGIASEGIDEIGAFNRPVVGCEDCHGPGAEHFGAGPITRPGADKCLGCHELISLIDNSMISTPTHLGGIGLAVNGPALIINDTHFAQPGVFNGSNGANTANIAGYSMDFSDPDACNNCHNPHSDNEINKQWAASGHAATDAPKAWAHYNWSDRGSCQRCHTTSGHVALATDMTNGSATAGLFPIPAPLTNDPAWMPEMLQCRGCHTSSYGTLRAQGSLDLTRLYNAPAGRVAEAPDTASNLCIACHSGSGSGHEIQEQNTDASIYGSNFGGFNSHYLAAGGILLRTIGYEYSGRIYESASNFEHNIIGTGAAPGTGSNGPCIGCHMRTPESHSLDPVIKDSGGTITDVPAYEKTCSNCHTGPEQVLIDELNHQEHGYQAALDVLQSTLETGGGAGYDPIFYKGAYPYIYNAASPPPGPAGWYTQFQDLDVLGAAFNLVMLRHEPGAFVHNRIYTKKLIYDSIDYADNTLIDNSVETTIGFSNIPALIYLSGTRP